MIDRDLKGGEIPGKMRDQMNVRTEHKPFGCSTAKIFKVYLKYVSLRTSFRLNTKIEHLCARIIQRRRFFYCEKWLSYCLHLS
jgi:hypothetical protein